MADLYPGSANSLPHGYGSVNGHRATGRTDIPVHPSLQAAEGAADDMMDDGYGEGDEDDEEDEEELDEESGEEMSPPGTKRRPAAGSSGRNAKAAKTNGGGPGNKGKVKGKGAEGPDGKTKATRGSRACTVCRRLKMRCLPGEDGGPPCKRCRQGGHECVFEESQRGKRSTKRTDILAKNLKTMEEKIDFVMSKMHPSSASPGPAIPSGLPGSAVLTSAPLPMPMSGAIASPSTSWAALHQAANAHSMASPAMAGVSGPSPYAMPTLAPTSSISPVAGVPSLAPLTPGLTAAAYGTTSTANAAPVRSHARFAEGHESRPPSPRLHSLPDNTLNPLGLLAEASLHSRHRSRRRASSGKKKRVKEATGDGEVAAGEVSDATASDSAQGSSGGQSGSSNAGGGGEGGPARAPRRGKVGVANQAYFQPGPMNILPLRRIVIEQRMPPSLLTDKVISSEEAVELFQIYFDRCNPHCCILDPDIHTPTLIGSRSPFLFTAVCAVASKFFTPRRDLHSRCLGAAKRCAFDVLIKGYKSVEIVQALLLLSLWNQPAERFEEDRTWAFSGIAIRMAQDLNLHRKTTTQLPSSVDDSVVQQYEREILNRERTWLYCFIIDRSLSAQMGKPYSIREDFIVRSSKTWHKQRCSSPMDYGLVAMVDMHRTFTRILDTIYSDAATVSGINERLDYSLLMRTFNQSLDAWFVEWGPPPEGQLPTDAVGGYRASMKVLYASYYRLFAMSFILENALKNPDKAVDLPQTFVWCYDSASRVIVIARDNLAPLGALRYAPDSHFIYISYATVFLLKMIRPEFKSYCDQDTIIGLAHDVIELFDKVAVDETHTPALYASFLRVLVTSKEASTAPSRAERTDADGVIKSEKDQPTPEQIEDALRRTQMGQYPGPPQQGSAAPGGAALSSVPSSVGLVGMDAFSDGRMLDGIWETMLMPGYGGGPLDGLSGGSGIVSQYQNNVGDANLFAFTPGHSGRNSPAPFYPANGLEFGEQDLLGTPHLRLHSGDATPQLPGR